MFITYSHTVIFVGPPYSQSATEEALKIQGNWISAYEKQLAISREVLKSFIDIASPAKALIEVASPTKAKSKAA